MHSSPEKHAMQLETMQRSHAALQQEVERLKSEALAQKKVAQGLEKDLEAARAEIAEFIAKDQLDSIKRHLDLAEKTGKDLAGCFQTAAVQVTVTPRLRFQIVSPYGLDLPGIVNIAPVCVDALAELSALQGYLARELVSCQSRDGGISSRFSSTASAMYMDSRISMGRARAYSSIPQPQLARVNSSSAELPRVSSDLLPFTRCQSDPITLGEKMMVVINCLSKKNNLKTDPKALSVALAPKDFDCVKQPARLLPVHANHMHNRSLRNVSDTIQFWREFSKQKFDHVTPTFELGYKGRKNTNRGLEGACV